MTFKVQMLNVGFRTTSELFTLLHYWFNWRNSASTSSSELCGGRYTLFYDNYILIVPAVFMALHCKTRPLPLWVFQLMALLSGGIGGGNFASSMSNISFFIQNSKALLWVWMRALVTSVTTVQICCTSVYVLWRIFDVWCWWTYGTWKSQRNRHRHYCSRLSEHGSRILGLPG